MKKIYIQSLTILIALLISSFLYAQNKGEGKPKTFKQEINKVEVEFYKAETVKKIGEAITRAGMDKTNRAVVSKTTQEIWKYSKDMSKEQMQKFLVRLSKMSNSGLSALSEMTPRQINNFIGDAAGKLSKNAGVLRQAIAGAGDKAGNMALQAISRVDDIIANNGSVPKALFAELKDAASKLPPENAKAYLDLLKKKFSEDWADIVNLEDATKGPGQFIGTVVDGVFVLNDAYDIYYSDDEPEVKAIKATSKIVDYGISTGAGVATTSLGAGELAFGAGLGVGLTIAFTANRVSTLYTEIAMLQKEKQAVKDAVKNERIDNAILVRRQLVNISNKIKSGQISNANSLLIKLDKFILNNNIDNLEKIYELHAELEECSKNAERNQQINEVINNARRPYQKAANFYKKGIELHIAKIYAAEALTILNNNLKIYPEIGGLTAISKTQQLISLIDKKIATAAEFSITRVAAPERVYVGQSIDIPVFVTGGIPYYSSVGEINSNISDDSEVTMFWYASVVPGIEKFSITLKDCMGSVASATVSIEVVEEIGEIEEENEEPVDVEYSGLKKFVDVSKVGSKTFESHYSAKKFHIGYSKEYRDKVYSGRGENNEGPWRTGNSGEGQETIWYILPHGSYKRYRTDNGNILIQEGNYNNGRWHGKWTNYFIKPDTQGGVEKIQNYKNGVLDGIQTTYIHYKSKEDWSKIENYKDGKKDGAQIEYDSEIPGGIGKERIYQNGKFISGYYYYFSGKEKGANGKYKNIYEKAIYEE